MDARQPILCLGDSITACDNFAECDRWPSVLQNHLEGWRPGGYAVVGCGVSGNTTAQGMERMAGQILPRLPGYVLIEFGFNDANCRPWQTKPRVGIDEYAANLRAIGEITRKHQGRPIYVVNYPVHTGAGKQGDGANYAKRVEAYNQRMRKVAKALRAPVIDLPALMKAHKVMKKRFYRDCVHVTDEGNRQLAAMLFDGLRPILDA